MPPTLAQVEAALHRRWIAAEGTALRKEDARKAREVHALLGEIARCGGRDPWLVDAAAGRAYVGLLAVELLGFRRVVVIEHQERHAHTGRALAAAFPDAEVSIHAAEVGDATVWPERPDIAVGLHACGPATDAIIERATAAAARWILLVPCCYGAQVPFWARARAIAQALGVPPQAEPLGRLLRGLVDAERTLRLEAAGYEVTVVPLVPPTVTPHNLCWRCRRALDPRRAADAARRLAALTEGPLGGSGWWSAP